MQPTPTTTDILYTILFHDKHHRWHTSNSHLFLLDGDTVTLPFSLPLLSLTYITRQERGNMPVAQRLGWWRTQCDPLLLGEAFPKIHKVSFSVPPAQNTYGGASTLPYPTTPLTFRSPKPNYGQLTPKGPHGGVAFCTPPFWVHGQVTTNPKKSGVQFWEPPFWAHRSHLPFFAVLDS